MIANYTWNFLSENMLQRLEHCHPIHKICLVDGHPSVWINIKVLKEDAKVYQFRNNVSEVLYAIELRHIEIIEEGKIEGCEISASPQGNKLPLSQEIFTSLPNYTACNNIAIILNTSILHNTTLPHTIAVYNYIYSDSICKQRTKKDEAKSIINHLIPLTLP